jgi:hypothetical protein
MQGGLRNDEGTPVEPRVSWAVVRVLCRGRCGKSDPFLRADDLLVPGGRDVIDGMIPPGRSVLTNDQRIPTDNRGCFRDLA